MTEGQKYAAQFAGLTLEQTFRYLVKNRVEYEADEHSGHDLEPHLLVFPDGSGVLVSLPDGKSWNGQRVVGKYQAMTADEVTAFKS